MKKGIVSFDLAFISRFVLFLSLFSADGARNTPGISSPEDRSVKGKLDEASGSKIAL